MTRRATISVPTRKRGKQHGPGGLGGPGGRGGRSGAMRELELGGGLPSKLGRLGARALASAVKEAAERESARSTPYHRAMAMLAGYADRESKRMKPETRNKLADAKRELRDLFGHAQTSYGEGGPGKERHKQKAKSRRTPR